MSDIDQSRLLQKMADKDIRALKAMIDSSLFDEEIFGFHGQQAVEKSLKAWIAAVGGYYGRTHDLKQLFLILKNLGCSTEEFDTLAELTPFAVEMRYDAIDAEEPAIDRPALVLQVEALYLHVEKICKTVEIKS